MSATIQKCPAAITIHDLLYSLVLTANVNLVTAPGGLSAEDLLWSLILGTPETVPGGGGSGVVLYTGVFTSMSESTGNVGDLWEDTTTPENVGYIFQKLSTSPHRWVAIAKSDTLPV